MTRRAGTARRSVHLQQWDATIVSSAEEERQQMGTNQRNQIKMSDAEVAKLPLHDRIEPVAEALAGLLVATFGGGEASPNPR